MAPIVGFSSFSRREPAVPRCCKMVGPAKALKKINLDPRNLAVSNNQGP